jgi:hypothetical protein
MDDRKQLAANYIKGWFTVDILAIIPFESILDASNLNGLVRLAKIGRLYKLVKLTRLLRVLKIMKDKTKLMKAFSDLLKIGLGFERLFFFLVLSLVLMHISACLWIILPQFGDYEEHS